VTKKNLTSQDCDLFRKSVGKVRIVKSDKVLFSEELKPRPFPKTRVIDPDEHLIESYATDIEKVSQEDTLDFLSPGLQKNILRKLRRGHFGLDAEIDLHGLNSNEARRQLLYFLHSCVQEGCRCVHIIHGKGYRSPENHPVLKNNLNLWLRQHSHVQAFCSAPLKNGGAGAVFVLLQLSDKYGRLEADPAATRG
jgi:DNA-nicking Smr family endonuclease